MNRLAKAFFAVWAVAAFGSSAQAQLDSLRQKVEEAIGFDCSQRYRLATRLYDEGRIDSALSVVQPCLESRLKLRVRTSRQTRANIFRLASEVNYLLDSAEEGERYALKMLALDPYYRADSEDLSRFRNTLARVFAMPQISAGLKAEASVTFVHALDREGVFESPDGQPIDAGEYSEVFISYSVGLLGEWQLAKWLSVRAEPAFARQSYEYFSEFTIPNTQSEVSTEYIQKMNYLQVPALVRFNAFPQADWQPYAGVGAFYQLLFQSAKESETALVDVTQQMQRHTFGFAGEAGLNYRLTGYSLNLGLRYYRMFGKANRSSNRFLNDRTSDVFIYQFYDAPDDISFSNVGLFLGITYHLNYRVFDK